MLGYIDGHDIGGEETAESLPRWRSLMPALLGIAFAVALALLLILANIATQERDRALSLQRHSYEVIALARAVEGSVAKAETLLARYVVSLDANDGRRYTDQWRQAGTLINNLRRETRDSPIQRHNMVLLRDAYEARGAVLNDIALRTTYDQRLGALGRLYEANKTREADRIGIILQALIDHEMLVLNTRIDRVDQSEERLAKVTGSYSLVGLVLLVAALAALWIANGAFNERLYARRLADAEARRVDDLEQAVHERTRELEVANTRLRTEMEERAQAEASLRQLHKMEAVGQLTGGIAHDFNNMLAVVTGGLELAGRRLTENPEAAQRHIDNAMEGANRAASLTRRLLAFARAEPLLPGAVDADALIHGMSELIDRTIGDQIEVVMKAGAGDWHLWADRHQLENALLNLCVNARDAMAGRGTLTIASGQLRLKAGEVQGCEPGDYVRLSVRDTGHGMSPEVLERVFEPFFTTKPVGKGTGLGLSQVLGYVQQCKGGIRILSEVGKGTEVQIFLPRDTRKEHLESQRRVVREAGAPAAPPQSILVVEDDQRVLNSTLSALEELGHACVSCTDPADAPILLGANPDVSMILTDVLMPGMSGPELVTELRANGVTIPVIYVTGFAGEGGEAGLLDGQNVLRKPFTLAQLDRAIASAIDEAKPGLDDASAASDRARFSA
jgi:signal transduction histidine kinase/ActR/RegA family two-component response regulator